MNQITINIAKHYESLHDGDLTQVGLQPKLCPANVWTEGYGRVIIDPRTRQQLKGIENKERAYQLASIKTEKEATEALLIDLNIHAHYANLELGLDYWNDLNDNQKGALTLFVYNCGTHYRNSKGQRIPYRIFQEIRDYLDGKSTAEDLEAYWKTSVTRGGGKVLRGLILRRASEVDLFLKEEI